MGDGTNKLSAYLSFSGSGLLLSLFLLLLLLGALGLLLLVALERGKQLGENARALRPYLLGSFGLSCLILGSGGSGSRLDENV